MRRSTLAVITISLVVLAIIIWLLVTNSQLLSFKLPLINWSFLPGSEIQSPFVAWEKPAELPLLKYTIPNLKRYNFQTSQIKIGQYLDESDSHWAVSFSYLTQGKKVSGVINFPKDPPENKLPVIVMLRGWVPQENYYPGLGTKNAAAYFAKNGFVTFAPDFLSYGQSDPEPENSWEARFIKPIQVIELIKTIKQESEIKVDLKEVQTKLTLSPEQLGLWGHSNGGQIALTVLEVLSEPIPTSLWAPVTAPFPYSILFFSDEHPDEGKQMRAWLAQLEQDYDVLEFSLTQYLTELTGPIQIHHGTADDAALISWSDEFRDSVELENERREKEHEEMGEIGEASLTGLEPINLTYYRYPGADHNLKPNWSQVVTRDVQFFNNWLQKN
ncbi:MAG: hypothetical protein GF381_01085 [Candidatus Pacebacteria bacterium]|nr:hypothetical protein [Candidatus Paceibacterota bacterium]